MRNITSIQQIIDLHMICIHIYIYTAYILYISCSMDLYVLFERCPYLYLQHSLRRPLKLLLEVVSLSIDCTTSHAFCLAVPFIPAYMNSTCCATESISSFSVVNLRDPQTQQTRIGFFTHPPILSINIYIYIIHYYPIFTKFDHRLLHLQLLLKGRQALLSFSQALVLLSLILS